MALKIEILPQLTAALTLGDNSKTDQRSDTEIIDSLLKRHPIVSRKNMWALWDKGFLGMPPEWTVRVVDKVEGSPLNTSYYIDSALLPASFSQGTIDGLFIRQHSADLTRCPYLLFYGSVWLDVGVILLTHLDDLCRNTLENPSSPHELCTHHIENEKG
jgi:hypothetical protein